MLSVAELNEIEQLDEFRLLWRTLWGKTRRASLFQTREWLQWYWRQYGAGRQLRVLIVSVAMKPVGIVPLIVKPVKTGLGTLRYLTYPTEGAGPFYGPIGANPAITLMGAMRHLESTSQDWDVLDLRGVDDDDFDRGRTANGLKLAGLAALKRAWEPVQAMDFPRWSLAEQFQFRHDTQATDLRLRREGKVRFQRFRSTMLEEGSADLLRELLQLCKPLWEGPTDLSADNERLSPQLQVYHGHEALSGSTPLPAISTATSNDYQTLGVGPRLGISDIDDDDDANFDHTQFDEANKSRGTEVETASPPRRTPPLDRPLADPLGRRSFDELSLIYNLAIEQKLDDIGVLWLNQQPVACAINVRQDRQLETVDLQWDRRLGTLPRDALLRAMWLDSAQIGDERQLFGDAETLGEMAEHCNANTWSYRFTHFNRFKPRAQLLRLNQFRKRWFDKDASRP